MDDLKLFQIAFGSAPTGMALIDPQGRFLQVNRALCELVGRSEEEMCELGFQQISHPDDLESSVLGWQRMLAGELDVLQYEKRLLHANGSVKWVLASIAIERDEQCKPVCIVGQAQDLTERKLAERQLQLTQFTVDSSSTPILWARRDARFVYVNDAALRQTGYTREELLSMTAYDINSEYPAQFWPEWVKALEREDSLTFETRHRHKDGHIMPVEITANLLRFEGEELLFAFVTDITERKQAERQLRLTQFTVDSSSTPILWARPDASFVYVNDAALRQSGYTREEMLSMTVHDLNPDFTVQYWPGWLKNLKRDESLTFETRHTNKDGSIMPVEVTVNLLRFEGEEYLFAFVTDITDRKRREAERERAVEALQESESRYRHIVEDQTDFVVRWLPDGVRTFANQAYCDYYGQSSEQIVGTSFYPLVAKEDLNSVHRRIESLSVDEPVSIGEHRTVRPDGTIAWNEWTDRGIFDEQGQLIEYQSVGRDITQRKKAEQGAREAIAATARVSLLSNREREVLNLVVSGKTNKVVAQRLRISERTVEKHRASVMRKLRATSAAELVQIAMIAEQSAAIH